MALTSLELSSATALQRVERLQRLSDEALKRYAVKAAADRDLEALWELVAAYLALRGGSGALTSRHTLRAYRRGIHELLTLWQGENLLRPSRDAGSLYVQRLLTGARAEMVSREPPRSARGRRVKDGPLSPATVGLRVAAARALYDALAWAQATEADPFRDVRIGKTSTGIDHAPTAHVYTEGELVALNAAARDRQEVVILLLGSHGGLRVSEMLRLGWADVDLREGELLVREGKGAKTATVRLSPRLSLALADYKREAAAALSVAVRQRDTVLELRSQYGVYNRLRALSVRADVPFKGVHALRHSAGTRLYQQTGDLGQVQDHLRHATLDMARRYARSDRRKLKNSLDDWQ
ncbi:MAG TPA: site-specific integrase [Trueperaceae bacterium]|nr:site-specific integrase [Trueperaceae bacterium]